MTIVEFLTARLDKQEGLARAAMRDGDDGQWRTGRDFEASRVEGLGIEIYDEGGHSEEQAAFIAANDPAYVLADIAARRAIVAEHNDTPTRTEVCQWQYTSISIGMEHLWPCDTLKLLVQPFADHPDFDPAWRL